MNAPKYASFRIGKRAKARNMSLAKRSRKTSRFSFSRIGNGRDRKMQKNKAPSFPIPTEAEEQIALFEWARLQTGRFPELALLYHVPNGGSRNKIEAARLRAQGVKSGVPDLCLPVARGASHGLYIELKRQRGGRISEEQVRWINGLLKQGYAAAICKGWQEAASVITDYLRQKTEG